MATIDLAFLLKPHHMLNHFSPVCCFLLQAVEPTEKVQQDSKGIMQFAPVIGVAALALISIPLLPVLFSANPDQV